MSITGTCLTHAGDFVGLKGNRFLMEALVFCSSGHFLTVESFKKILMGPSTIDLWNLCLCGDSQYVLVEHTPMTSVRVQLTQGPLSLQSLARNSWS